MEIERKFTIKDMPKDLERYEKEEIEQGYLCTNPVVRIRKCDERYVLTYKSPYLEGKSLEGIRMSNEMEALLTKEAYERLSGKIDNHFIQKTRYRIPYGFGLTIELDVFHGRLNGLTFAEVEFPSKEEAQSFQVPEWFDQDVSTDGRYSNAYLSTLEEWRM